MVNNLHGVMGSSKRSSRVPFGSHLETKCCISYLNLLWQHMYINFRKFWLEHNIKVSKFPFVYFNTEHLHIWVLLLIKTTHIFYLKFVIVPAFKENTSQVHHFSYILPNGGSSYTYTRRPYSSHFSSHLFLSPVLSTASCISHEDEMWTNAGTATPRQQPFI